MGWLSFGRCIEALLLLYELTGDKKWRNEAIKWGKYALGLQGQNGCFYLIYNDYYNFDIAADEIRGLKRCSKEVSSPLQVGDEFLLSAIE
ncbi:hypothetical protein SAMN02746089_02651 [Caldanaerobius fijiensis DSM 17918]|uniref:Uncharacterized protein n=1 Tax=Caldanaerobius fijiensis DSM 17918 TaxID=1121256 RepID=A0A1M5EZD6_9THEO|nr:hypothetical protein SAMN02746089_02651 [Caldanaerobius fijiensis DSM 17918]